MVIPKNQFSTKNNLQYGTLITNSLPMKSTIHFLQYALRHDKKELVAIIVDTAILIFALCHWQELTSQTSLIAFMALLLMNYIWQLYNVAAHFWSVFHPSEYGLDGTIVSSAHKNSFMLSPQVQDKYTVMPDLDCFIMPEDPKPIIGNEPIRIQISTHKHAAIRQHIESLWDIYVLFLNNKYHTIPNFFNEKKLCMGSEIIGDQASGYYVKVYDAGEYYESYLTNAIFNKYLIHRDSGVCLYPPYNAKNSEISLLEDSPLNNHIGVSTLAVTSDGSTFALVQNNRAAFNNNKLIPSGSGSVDYADWEVLAKDDSKADFRQVICSAAERELSEETSLPCARLKAEGKLKTKIIGFYRDLRRGRKPEFCCATYIQCKHADLNIRPLKAEQYTNMIFPIPDIQKANEVMVKSEFVPSETLLANLYFLSRFSG